MQKKCIARGLSTQFCDKIKFLQRQKAAVLLHSTAFPVTKHSEKNKETASSWVDLTILFALVYQISLPMLKKSSKLREMSKRYLTT